MTDVAIRAEGLSKRYRIRQGTRARYETLYDRLAHAVTPWRWFRSGNHRAQDDYIWALKDVSFEVKRGEVVGIIGRNGAGKSTLLKVLARITEPTEGYAEVRGRVGSLLEVGTGFHPELTGRENIYLNGAILGMRKAEIDRKFDEIVAFAEIEKFMDTPVKFYSSGMYVRLAFAVAAHLDPEILLVDEVLAVGDAAFQKKCLGKMGEVAGEGRTVLFVSHNMGAVRELTHYSIWLNEGEVVAIGESGLLSMQYVQTTIVQAPTKLAETKWARLAAIIESSRPLDAFSPFTVVISIEAFASIVGASVFGCVESIDGLKLATWTSRDAGVIMDLRPGGRVQLTWSCTRHNFAPGRYRMSIFLDDRFGQPLASTEIYFDVENLTLSPRYNKGFAKVGYMVLDGHWIK